MSDATANTVNQLNLQKDPDYEKITKPFADDLLGRETLAQHLTGYIDRLKVGAVLAIDAPWGEGKTYFVRNWKAYLEKEDNPHNVIYLNAFAQDYLDDPFMVLSAEIAHAFDANNDQHRLIQSFKDKAINVTKALLPELPKLMLSLGITLMGAGYLGKTLENTVSNAQGAINTTKETYGDEVFDGINETINENIQEAIKERFEKHETDKQTLESFKQSLQALAADENLNPQPLVFIIDELDRCNPMFSVRLIERIKHFFDIPNIVFVLVTDKTQLQATICHQFGYNEAASEAYLDKFIDFSIKLERPKNIDRKDEYLQIISTILTNLGFSNDEIGHYKYLALIFATVHNKSIRQIKKILNRFSLLYISYDIKRNYFLLYKLFHPQIDNQTPMFVHMFYELIQYFDDNLKHKNGNDIDEYIKTSLFTYNQHGQIIPSEYAQKISYDISNISYEMSFLFKSLSDVIREYIEFSSNRGSWLNISYDKFCIKQARTPFEINKDWDTYISTGLKL